MVVAARGWCLVCGMAEVSGRIGRCRWSSLDSFRGASVYKSMSSVFPSDPKAALQSSRACEGFISWEIPAFVIWAPCVPLFYLQFLVMVEGWIVLTMYSYH